MNQGWSMQIPIVVAVLSLSVSALTVYLTLLRSGALRMTRATFIAFVGGAFSQDGPKVVLRGMLYATSVRGKVVENMFVRLSRAETNQTFNVWGYQRSGTMQRGGGLFVGLNGIAIDHHFSLPRDGTDFIFLQGNYILEIHASLVGKKGSSLLSRIPLKVGETEAANLQLNNSALYFDWGADSNSYHPYVSVLGPSLLETLPRKPVFSDLLCRSNKTVVCTSTATELTFPIRVINVTTVPVQVEKLTISWCLSTGRVGKNGRKDHQEETKELIPGAEEVFFVRSVIDPIEGEIEDIAQLDVGIQIFLRSDDWDGLRKWGFDAMTLAKVADQRRVQS